MIINSHVGILLEVNEGHTIELFELLPILGGSDIAIPLESVSFDCDTFDFTVVSQPYGSQTIIPDVLELENVAFSLSMLLSNAETLTVFFGGQWTIVDDTAVEVGVQYTRETGQFDITAIPTGTRFDFVALASSLTGLTLPNPFGGSLSFDSFLISGVITADNIATMIISQKFNSPQIFIIFHKVPGENLKKAIAVEYLNFDFSSLISQLTSVDISRVPYFGSITAPGIGLTISSADISDLPADIFATTTLLISNEDGVENGIIAYLKFEFFDDPIKMTFDEILTFSPSVANLKVNDLLSAIPNVDFSSIPVPFDISEILAVDITSFSLSHEEKAAISVEVQYSNGLSFFDGFISIINADITLALSRNPTKMRVQVAGEMNIRKSSFTASLFLDDNDKYVLRASASLLPITNVISQFQAEVLPPELSSLFTDFSFSIKKPRISYPLSSVPKTIQIGGIPVFSGYKTVRMDAIILRQTSKTYLVQGYDIPGVNMADFLQDISGFSFKKIALFNQDLEVVTLISPITLPNIRLTGERLQEYSITKGVSIQAQMSFPSDCASDAFCAVAQFLLGENAMLLLHGTFQSSTNFAVFAGVSDFSVGSGLIISNAGLEVQAGTETTAGITGSIILSDPPITLTSRIFLSTSGVVLEMTQSGCWDDAFGASWLAICNIQGAIGMVPGLLVTSLEVGGEVRLGDPSCFAPIIAIGFLGIDAVTPTNNYYYVQFGVSTTVASLMNAFCVNVNLPRPLGESGFPNGFLSSFSLIGKELPHAGISILQGFRLNGTLNILGLQGSADVTINVPSGLHFSVELPPINVGNGLLRMFASRRESSRGPFLTASITLLPSVNINIAASGYVRVLGISTEASLRITNTKYEYIISGKMLNLFQSDLVISASYGSISQASFRVRGSFRNDLYDKITKKIKDTLQASANEATDAIDKAQRRVDNEQEKFDNANRDLRAARREVNKANADFEKANKDLKSAKDHVNKVCSIKKCGSGKFQI